MYVIPGHAPIYFILHTCRDADNKYFFLLLSRIPLSSPRAESLPSTNKTGLFQPPHPFNSPLSPSSLPTILSRGEHVARLVPARVHPVSCSTSSGVREEEDWSSRQTGQDEMRERDSSSSFRTFSISLVSFTLLFRSHLDSISISLSVSFPPSSSLFRLPHRSTSTLYSTRVCRAIYFRICRSVYCFLPLVYSK